MKYIRQFSVILLISFIGELLDKLLPLPVPAGIYGLLILFTGLKSGLIPYESVKDAGHFLNEAMIVMYVPTAVGICDSWKIIQPLWAKYLLVVVVSGIAVIFAAGRVSQYFLRRNESKGGSES